VAALLTSSPRDRWVLAALSDTISEDSIRSLDSKGVASLWESAVREGLTTDDEILVALSARTHIGITSDLLVSSTAREMVSERLARRFAILPLRLGVYSRDRHIESV
jgi:hypothetical protein